MASSAAQASLGPPLQLGQSALCSCAPDGAAKSVELIRGGGEVAGSGHAGAAAMILVNDEATGNDLEADPHVLPAVHISYADGLALLEYIKNTK